MTNIQFIDQLITNKVLNESEGWSCETCGVEPEDRNKKPDADCTTCGEKGSIRKFAKKQPGAPTEWRFGVSLRGPQNQ